MTPMLLRAVDNRAKDGRFVDDLQDENAALRREIKRLREVSMVHHRLDFSKPTPMGFALCIVCGDYVNQEQWSAWPCRGAKREEPAVRPRGGLRCVLCGAPVLVDPTHRSFVAVFGATCSSCFDKEPIHG